MTATEGVPQTFYQKHRALVVMVIGVVSFLGAGTSFYFYKRHADVWLRHPPRMPSCIFFARRVLAREETISGSIPHMAPDGNMVYLRPNEDRAVTCMARLSPPTATLFAAAFAELDPDKRARALAAILRDHISPDPSADAQAVAAWLMTTAAFRALPKKPEIELLQDELDQRNACRFALHSPCPSRPPIPMRVWVIGAPSSVGLVFSIGIGAKSLTTRIRAWWQKRRAAKAKAHEATNVADATESESEEKPPSVNP